MADSSGGQCSVGKIIIGLYAGKEFTKKNGVIIPDIDYTGSCLIVPPP